MMVLYENRDTDLDDWEEEYELEFESNHDVKNNGEVYWEEMSFHKWSLNCLKLN